MNTRELFFSLSLLVFATTLFAQEAIPTQPAPPSTPLPDSTHPGAAAAMPRMNPTMLLRMRNQMTFELQEIQRIIGLVNPDDTQLLDMHKQRQKEVVDQLKDIETQLKAQGVPVEEDAVGVPAHLGVIPPAQDPTLVPGGIPQPPTDPNLLVQTRQPGMPQMPPGFQMMNPVMPPQTVDGTNPMQPSVTGLHPLPGPPTATIHPNQYVVPPTGFDQDQAWANSPWVPQPSKELTEMKQTVETLRKEIGDLKSTVKALETQIQLLNRNILLSQPQPSN